MRFTVLASGSSGNATLIESKETKVLIDCGTTKRYLSSTFDELNLLRSELTGLVLTHSHGDHIQQIKHFSEVPTYSPFELDYERKHEVIPYQEFSVGDLTFTPIELSHDTDITVGYVIDDGDYKLVYITDTGYVKVNDYELLRDADYYIVESNFDSELLMRSNRPYLTKQRILSDRGHLSNDAASELLAEIVSKRTKHIVLAHISQEANEPELAIKTVKRGLNGYRGLLEAAPPFGLVKGGYRD